MHDWRTYFEGKRITVMGLGLLGRGVGDALFLAECGAEVTVTDLKDETQLKDSVQRFRDYPNVRFVLGEHRMEDFEGRDFILKAAGVPLDSPYVAHAREHGVPIEMSAALFARLSGIPIIGITGTRGKSTVTHMVHHVLREATEGAPVLLGGNVRGVSNLQLLKDAAEDAIAVLELDSWQLQGFGEAKISPQIAVFTNFMDDHLNYYAGDRDRYFADKANIFLYQEESDVLVTTPDVFERIRGFAAGKGLTLGQEVVLTDASGLPEDCLLSMPGAHNRLNAALAYEALKATSLMDEEIFAGLASFPGVPGRLEYMGEADGVKIYNDNNATTPAATVAALKALSSRHEGRPVPVVLIMGGADKGIDTKELADTIPTCCKAVVLLPGTGSEKMQRENPELKLIEAPSLEGAVRSAFEEAAQGDVILFSPAFASFGLFTNEYDRGDQFGSLIQRRIESRA